MVSIVASSKRTGDRRSSFRRPVARCLLNTAPFASTKNVTLATQASGLPPGAELAATVDIDQTLAPVGELTHPDPIVLQAVFQEEVALAIFELKASAAFRRQDTARRDRLDHARLVRVVRPNNGRPGQCGLGTCDRRRLVTLDLPVVARLGIGSGGDDRQDARAEEDRPKIVATGRLCRCRGKAGEGKGRGKGCCGEELEHIGLLPALNPLPFNVNMHM